MNTTEYINNVTTTTLDPVNAALWLAHDWRECVRKMITHLSEQYEAKRELLVVIEATRTLVILSSVDPDAQDIHLNFRHWCTGYAGCIVEVEDLESKAFAWVSNQWINLD